MGQLIGTASRAKWRAPTMLRSQESKQGYKERTL